MHIEYAADAVVRMESQAYAAQLQVKNYTLEKEFLALAASLGGLTAEIVAAVRDITSTKTYRKVTEKQRHAISAALLEKCDSPRAVFAAAYGVSEEDFMANAGK